MKSLFVLILLTANMASATPRNSAATLKQFEDDQCTFFAEGTSEKPNLWAHCCFEHDLRYWFGGSKAQRAQADLELKACVKNVAGDRWANLMYRGVIAGHGSPIKSKYVWSWGWQPERNFEPLTPSDVLFVIEQLGKLPLENQFRDHFIEKYLK